MQEGRVPLRGRGAVYLSFMPPLRALRVSAGWYQFVYLFVSLWRWPGEHKHRACLWPARWRTVRADLSSQPVEASVFGGTSWEAPVVVGGPCSRKAA